MPVCRSVDAEEVVCRDEAGKPKCAAKPLVFVHVTGANVSSSG